MTTWLNHFCPTVDFWERERPYSRVRASKRFFADWRPGFAKVPPRSFLCPSTDPTRYQTVILGRRLLLIFRGLAYP